MTLIYREQTEILRRCFFDVQNEVGLGRQEEAYHQACVLWLRHHGIPFQSKRPHKLRLCGEVAHKLIPDLIVWDRITVEVKSLQRKLAQSEFVQLFDYLKYRRDRLGLLVNMGLDRVHVERIVFDAPDYALKEDWRYWTARLSGRVREVALELRTAMKSIYDHHTTGYGEETSDKLISFALQQRHLKYVKNPLSKAYFRGQLVDECPLHCAVVEDSILLVFTALFDNNRFNISRGLSYMEALDLNWGIAVNFGRQCAEFTGLHKQ